MYITHYNKNLDPDDPFEDPELDWNIEWVPDDNEEEIEAFIKKREDMENAIVYGLRIAEKTLYEEYFESSKNDNILQAFKSVQDALVAYHKSRALSCVLLSDPREEPTFRQN